MRIIQVHNGYIQPSGEGVVALQEVAMLREAGHEVVEYHRSNNEIKLLGLEGKLALAKRVIWASDSARSLESLIRSEKPDLVHFHNTFVMVSPSAYYACSKMKVPVVQTLHNYRLLCPRGDFFRENHRCEDCLEAVFPWPGVLHACYHRSQTHSAAVAAMITVHRWLRTWSKRVDTYIALTQFSSRKFVEGGLPAGKIMIKPNFVSPDPGMQKGSAGYALFVGRFSPEKRLRTLISAWKEFPAYQLKVVGGGPEESNIHRLAQSLGRSSIEFLGQRPRAEVIALMKNARFVIFPSEWYEGFPLVIVEAFACGVPVIASRLGAMAEIVGDGRTGLHFVAGDSGDLAAKVGWAWTHEKEMQEMGKEARREYEEKYTAEKNYKILMDIYQRTIERATARGRTTT
jgi:glycosyltransferase involved in cell wall biosynthesis